MDLTKNIDVSGYTRKRCHMVANMGTSLYGIFLNEEMRRYAPGRRELKFKGLSLQYRR